MKRKAIFLLLMTILLSSCQSESTQPVESETTANVTVVETAVNDPLKDNLPDDLDYNGYNYTIFTFGGGNTGNTNQQYLVIEEMDGDTVNDAAYQRNMEVEDRLNIKLTCLESAESHTQLPAELTKYVAAGDSTIDLCVMFVATSIHDLVLNNVL